MKAFLLIIVSILSFTTLYSQDAIILQSGRKVEGVVIVKGNEVHLSTKYGTIIYDASTVKIVNNAELKTQTSETTNEVAIDSAEKSEYDINTFQRIVPISETIVSRSGRKLVGNIFTKGKDMFLSDLGGTVRIDPFVITPKEDGKSQKIRGEVISGEKCNVILTSGRSFSGVVIEEDELYYVSTTIGTIKVEKKNVDHIQKTGIVLNIKEEIEKAELKAAPKNAEIVATPQGATVAKTNPHDMSSEEIKKIDKKIEDSLKDGNEKVIKTEFENE